MLNIVRRNRPSVAPSTGGGHLQVPLTPPMQSVLAKLGEGWQCGPERAAERILVLALTGWRPQSAHLLDRLSQFVPGQADPLRRTCVMLRNHFDATEIELGEAVSDSDRTAWLETLLQALQERRESRAPALLADLLATGALNADGTI